MYVETTDAVFSVTSDGPPMLDRAPWAMIGCTELSKQMCWWWRRKSTYKHQ